PFPLHREETARHQPGEMSARPLCGQPGDGGQLAGRQRAAIGERDQHGGAARFCDQRRDRSEIRFSTHTSIIAEAYADVQTIDSALRIDVRDLIAWIDNDDAMAAFSRTANVFTGNGTSAQWLATPRVSSPFTPRRRFSKARSYRPSSMAGRMVRYGAATKCAASSRKARGAVPMTSFAGTERTGG